MCAKDKFVMEGPSMGKLLNKDLYRSVYNNYTQLGRFLQIGQFPQLGHFFQVGHKSYAISEKGWLFP